MKASNVRAWLLRHADEDAAHRPWSKGDRLALAALVAASLASLPWLVHPWYDASNDASMYLVTARSLATGEGYTYLGEPFRVRPPGFSALVAPVLAARGADFAALNLYVSLWGVAAVALLFVHLRVRLGALLAAGVAAALWLNPTFRTLCNQPMSDVPALALLLAGLALERHGARAPSWRRDLILGAAIGLAAYVRTILVLLAPAVVAARALERGIRGEGEPWGRLLARLSLVLLATAVVMLPWTLHGGPAPGAPVDQTALDAYGTAWLHADPGDPWSRRLSADEILERVPRRGRAVAASLASRLQRGSDAPVSPFALPILACWLWVLLKRRAPAELFVGGGLLVLSTYFAFVHRLVLPVFALVLGCVAEALRDAIARFAPPRAATGAVAAGLLVLVVADLPPRRHWDRIEARHRRFTAGAAAIAEAVGPEARLASGFGWHLNVYLGRPVYTLAYAVGRAGHMAAAETVIDRYGIDTVVLSNTARPDRALLAWFAARYPAAGEAGDWSIFRVRPKP